MKFSSFLFSNKKMNLPPNLQLGQVIITKPNLFIRDAIYNGDRVMVKEYNLQKMTNNEIDRLKYEMKILSIINSRYLVHHCGFFKNNSKAYVVLEYLPGNTLSEYMKSFVSHEEYIDEETICRAIYNLATALKYLHEEREDGRLLHRDINPNTIMISIGGEFVLSDLSCAKYSDDILQTITNDPSYRAPEMISGKYDYKIDIWSLGCVIYEMCTLKSLFTTNNIISYTNGITPLPKINRIPLIYSQDLNDIIQKCLEINPNDRYSSDDILHTDYIQQYVAYRINFIFR